MGSLPVVQLAIISWIERAYRRLRRQRRLPVAFRRVFPAAHTAWLNRQSSVRSRPGLAGP
jgi:hypothetical protein